MKWIEEADALLGQWGGKEFYTLRCIESIDSTNEEIKREALTGALEGTVLAAEEQTAGKGRRGRTWKSPAGEALYFSFLLRPSFAPEHIPMLTLVMGLSAAQAVQEMPELAAHALPERVAAPVQIKWPNDLVMNGKKICGILTEAVVSGEGLKGVVIGCGINVNNAAFPEEIQERATSLYLESGAKLSRGELLARVLCRFHSNYQIFAATETLAALKPLYNERLAGIDGKVRVESPLDAYTGISRGIDEFGCLLVEHKKEDTGDIVTEPVSSGEVSVRGLYGYV